MPASHSPYSVPGIGRSFLCFPTLLTCICLLMMVLAAFPWTRFAGVPFWYVEPATVARIQIIPFFVWVFHVPISAASASTPPPPLGECAWGSRRASLVIVVLKWGGLEPHASTSSTATTSAASVLGELTCPVNI